MLLVACAAGPNTAAAAGPGGAGFWLGLWHGVISPITFLISLFTDQVSIYEVHNDGAWYDFGFLLGIAAAFSGPTRARADARRPRSTRPARRGGEPPSRRRTAEDHRE